MEITVTNKRLGGLTISNMVSGNAGSKTQKFPFTLTLNNTSFNGTYGELNFVSGAAVFELADGESTSVTELPQGTGYTVTENNSYEHTVISTNAGGIITGEIKPVIFDNYKAETVIDPEESDNPDDLDEPDNSDDSEKPEEPSKPGGEDNLEKPDVYFVSYFGSRMGVYAAIKQKPEI